MTPVPNPRSDEAPDGDAGGAMDRPGSRGRSFGHIALWSLLWILGLLAVLFTSLAWYATTPAFQNRVRRAVIAQLENSTGGRVELKRFGWRLTHLEFEADDLTIHGLEAPDQIPYAHVDRLFVRLQILSFFRPRVGLNLLQADHPVFHLIVYPNGTTNQPRPKHPSTGDTKNKIFDLAVNRTVLNNGLAILNERRIPLNLTARNLAASVSYVPARDHYTGTVHAEDIVLERGALPPLHSVLDASLDVGRNTASLVSLSLQSGPAKAAQRTVVRVAGTLNDYNDPHWQFSVKGAVDALEIRALTGMSGLDGGTAQLTAAGSGIGARFNIDGIARISGGAYSTGTVHAAGVTADAVAHINQDLISIPTMHARLASGGTIAGSLRITNWQPPANAAPKTGREQGTIRTHIAGFTVDSVLDTVAPPGYRRLGFDGSASGTANVDWTGSLENVIGTVDVTLAPSRPVTPDEVPLTGVVKAAYINRTGSVEIRTFDIHTPASQVQATGSLGVYPITRPTQIDASLATTNLGEFNAVLATVGLGKPGRSPIPAQLHGEAQFHGVVAGNLDLPEFRGHLEATDFDIVPPASAQTAGNIHFDSLTSDADYTAGSLSISAATLVQGKTIIQASGQVHGRRDSPWQLFSDSSSIEGNARISNAEIAQWIALTGKKYPVSGTLNFSAQATGTIGDLNSTGHLNIADGAVYGEKYHSLSTDLHLQGRDLRAASLVFAFDGGRVTGDGGYDLASKQAYFAIQGNGFDLGRIPRLHNQQYPVTGTVVFTARGSGTFENPALQASLHLRNLSVARESTGFVDADAHTEGHALLFNLTAHLNTASVELKTETQLGGDYLTRASLNIAKFDIDPLLRTFSVSGIRGSSSIAAAVTVAGPLRHPKQLSGDARVSELNLTLEDVPIRSDGTLHATLRAGTLQIDPIHIVGPDTDLHTQGSLGVFAAPHLIRGSAHGSINMSLAQTLDTDIISSGHVDFNVTAEGSTASPQLTGQVKFTNVNVALEDYTNGLSRMNGSLAFDENRLEFKDVTAYSGGGLIRLGGFVTYQHGLYADLTATAKEVRIRYPQGVTSTADATLRFQGSRASMVLGGGVTITGFAVSPDLDLASVTSSTSNVSLPPSPNSPSTRVRLDIRVNSAPSLNFQNSFARLAGNVDLAVRGTLAQPTVLGRVTVTEGTATFNGEKFELQHGEIYFSNPVRIQPVIDLIATTTVEDYTITISLQGTTNKLNPTFRSEPPLSEQDIFSLLAMGRTQEEQQIYSTEEAQAGVNSTADSLLGGALNATISNRIQKLFGGGSVRIDPTFVSGVGNATARITIQEPISKQATLTYATNVNSTAEQLIQGEWRVTQDFSILAVRDESGVFSLIFRLHRRYH